MGMWVKPIGEAAVSKTVERGFASLCPRLRLWAMRDNSTSINGLEEGTTMPKPKSVTPEDIARWDRGLDEYDPTADGLPEFIKTLPGIKERAWYPGEWLRDQL